MMKREIGSNFWLSEADLDKKIEKNITPASLGCFGSDYVWLSSGRSAISFIINEIEKRNPNLNKIVCIPGFTCDTVYEPFMKAGYNVRAFPVRIDLKISAFDILEYVKKVNPGIILYHKYFGFDTLLEPERQFLFNGLHKKNIILIEDLTQCLYSSLIHSDADYYIGSIRKWSGVLDGGFAVCKAGLFEKKPTEIDFELERIKIEASLLKNQYMNNIINEKQSFLEKYGTAEELIGCQKNIYKISPVSYQIMTNLDVRNLKVKRRNNFKLLLNNLKDMVTIKPVFNEIPQNVVPLYFPMLCENRALVQLTLKRNQIFAPIVWPKDSKCPRVNKEVDYLYDHLLCVPIDQRYDSDDMNKIIEVLKTNSI